MLAFFTTVGGWLTRYRLPVAVVAGVLLLGGGGWAVRSCVQRKAAQEADAEVARLREAASKAQGKAEAREELAESIGLVTPALVDAEAALERRAEDAKRREAERLDAGRDETVDDILDELRTGGVWN